MMSVCIDDRCIVSSIGWCCVIVGAVCVLSCGCVSIVGGVDVVDCGGTDVVDAGVGGWWLVWLLFVFLLL